MNNILQAVVSEHVHVHACSPSYTDEECVFGLLIIVLIVL